LYQEAINFKGKAIAVKSAAEPAVIEAAGMDAVTFHAGEGPGSVLKNFIIRNSGMAISANYGSSPTISNLTIVNNDFGIAAYEDSDPNVSNCIVWDNKYGDLFGCEARYSWVQQELEPDLYDPNGGLVSHWAFDEGAGLIAYDSAGSNDGVVFGAKWASGQLGGALDFDGADDYIEVSDNASLSLTGAVTVGAWIWLDPAWLPPGHGGAGAIVCKHRDVTGKGYSLRVQGDRHLRALLNGNAVVSQLQVPVGRWTYVALTFESSGSRVVLYINGSEDSSASIAGTLTASGCGLRIGGQSCYAGGTGSEVFYGTIDDVRLYNRALSASEVLQLYEPVAGIDPLFADPAGGDYHLLSERGRYWPEHDIWVLDRKTSPCIDGGDPAVDPSGEPMPNGGRINIGAYGGTVQASMSEWPIASDYNRDGRTNFEDLAVFCEEWLATFPWADGQAVPPEPEPEPDLAPPTPDPMVWDPSGLPHDVWIGPDSTFGWAVAMTSAVASDPSGPVQYYFESLDAHAYDSGWIATKTYTTPVVGRSAQLLRFRVKARDAYNNETAWSPAESSQPPSR
jgi:parallel beta-helix repeat protein